MDRIPEPELMNELEQAKAYAGADFEEPHQLFVTLLRQRLPALPRRGHAVELCCGPGDVTMRFARVFPEWTVVGLDGALAMLALGREAVARAGLAGRVTLLERYLPADLSDLEPPDLVYCNASLHHLADPQVLWETAAGLLPSGGPIVVMDLLRPPTREAAAALVERYAASEPEVLRRDFHASLLASYEPAEVEAQLADAGLGDVTVEVVTDRHWLASSRSLRSPRARQAPA